MGSFLTGFIINLARDVSFIAGGSMESLGFIFGGIGMSMGIIGFIFGLVSITKVNKLENQINELKSSHSNVRSF